jgi:hypothetical protein
VASPVVEGRTPWIYSGECQEPIWLSRGKSIISEIEQANPPLDDDFDIPIDFHIPEVYPNPYASDVVVQVGKNELVICFFQADLPFLTGNEEENLAKLRQMKSIPANCVGRVTVPPDLVPELINALQTALDGYHSFKQQNPDQDQGETIYDFLDS